MILKLICMIGALFESFSDGWLCIFSSVGLPLVALRRECDEKAGKLKLQNFF